MFQRTLMVALFCFFATSTGETNLSAQGLPTSAAQPGWSPVIVASGAYRDQIRSTPIQYRPNRPLHVYGNVVRRLYWGRTPAIPVVPRGFAVPLIQPTGAYSAAYPTTPLVPTVYPGTYQSLPPWGAPVQRTWITPIQGYGLSGY